MRFSLVPLLVAAVVLGVFIYLMTQVESCDIIPAGCSRSIGGVTMGKSPQMK